MTSATGPGVGDRYGAERRRRYADAGWWSDRHLTSYLDDVAAARPGRRASPTASDR